LRLDLPPTPTIVRPIPPIRAWPRRSCKLTQETLPRARDEACLLFFGSPPASRSRPQAKNVSVRPQAEVSARLRNGCYPRQSGNSWLLGITDDYASGAWVISGHIQAARSRSLGLSFRVPPEDRIEPPLAPTTSVRTDDHRSLAMPSVSAASQFGDKLRDWS
jgi:hypothetical protein